MGAPAGEALDVAKFQVIPQVKGPSAHPRLRIPTRLLGGIRPGPCLTGHEITSAYHAQRFFLKQAYQASQAHPGIQGPAEGTISMSSSTMLHPQPHELAPTMALGMQPTCDPQGS